ncbi:MAG: hypothetical protein Kow00108_12930 [Calditrichia bacterium]
MKLKKLYILGFLSLLMAGNVFSEGGKKITWNVKPKSETKKINYHFQFAKGVLNLNSGLKDPLLLKGEFVQEFNKPVFDYYHSEGIAFISIFNRDDDTKKEDSHKSINIKSIKIPKENNWDIQTPGNIPSEYKLTLAAAIAELKYKNYAIRQMDLEAGASEVSLIFQDQNQVMMENLDISSGASKIICKNLANANARYLSFESGVGKNELEFSGTPRIPCRVNITNGVGLLKIYIPTTLASKFIVHSSLFSSFSIDNVVKENNIYYSKNFDESKIYYTFEINNSLGSVQVIWINTKE